MTREPPRGGRSVRPILEPLEDRLLLSFSVIHAEVQAIDGWRLVVDFDQPALFSTVQASDLLIDGVASATGVNPIDADTVAFQLPILGAGTHSFGIAQGTILDTLGTGLESFNKSATVASAGQFTVKHSPRLQLGNAPLTGFPGSEQDRVDILWQTIPTAGGNQDTFTVDYRLVGASGWQSVGLNAGQDTGIEGRVVRSTTITGLDWNTAYEYRVRHWRADVVIGQYQSGFQTRLQAGDDSAFNFVAYGDSASGSALGFRQVQARINLMDPAFAVLLGDNVYTYGSHQESDARFDPSVNPEAARWMAGHIDYLGLGNHDVATASGLPSEQNYSVPIPVAGVTAPAAPPSSERPEHNFSWDYGNVHFVTFDTNSLSDATRLDELLDWVVADVRASDATWKIVYGHHPLAGVPDKPESPGDNYYQQVVNRLKAAGVDLFMTGHSHTYSWTYPLTGQINGTATYIDHGVDDAFHAGEGLTQLVSGVGGLEVRPGDFSGFPFVAEGFSSSTPVVGRLGFTQVQVTPTQLVVSYIAADSGAVIDSFTITRDVAPTTVAFQQGVNGYSGTVDTSLRQSSPSTNQGAASTLKVDADDPGGTGLAAQTLLRFDNLFGDGPGQIPLNAVLRSATLQLEVANPGDGMNLHRMVSSWSSNDTWNTLGNGVQANGTEAIVSPDISTGVPPLGTVSFSVLTSLQAWQTSPASNRGWVLLPTGPDGVDFNSAEGATPPRLTVTYVANTPPTAMDDSVRTSINTPVFISATSNDTDVDHDRLIVQSVSLPAHGSVAIQTDNTLRYTPTSGYLGTDQFTYTINDGRGGTASASVHLQVTPTLAILLVTEVYRLSLARLPSPSELAGWSSTYATQGLTALVSGVEQSLEARIRVACNYFLEYLGRWPSDTEAYAWGNYLLQVSNETALIGILSSPEFYIRAQALVSSGTPDQRFVQALYQAILRRPAEAGGLAGWAALIPTQGRPFVVQGIVASVEHRMVRAAALFLEILQRPISPAETAAYGWSGLSLQQMRLGILGSPEFAARVTR